MASPSISAITRVDCIYKIKIFILKNLCQLIKRSFDLYTIMGNGISKLYTTQIHELNLVSPFLLCLHVYAQTMSKLNTEIGRKTSFFYVLLKHIVFSREVLCQKLSHMYYTLNVVSDIPQEHY